MARPIGVLLLAALLFAPGAAAGAQRCVAEPPDAERPWVAAAGIGLGFGFFYSTHGRLALQAGRRLWRRLELDLELRFGFGSDLFGLEPAVRVGGFFPLSRSAQVAVAFRGGYGHYLLVEPARSRWVPTAVVGVAIEVRLRLSPIWELRVIPAACTIFVVAPLWGVAVEPTLGIARRF